MAKPGLLARKHQSNLDFLMFPASSSNHLFFTTLACHSETPQKPGVCKTTAAHAGWRMPWSLGTVQCSQSSRHHQVFGGPNLPWRLFGLGWGEGARSGRSLSDRKDFSLGSVRWIQVSGGLVHDGFRVLTAGRDGNVLFPMLLFHRILVLAAYWTYATIESR